MEDNILKINYEDKEITLIGTSHVLQESAELVKRTIDAVCPDTVKRVEETLHLFKNSLLICLINWLLHYLLHIVLEKLIAMYLEQK